MLTLDPSRQVCTLASGSMRHGSPLALLLVFAACGDGESSSSGALGGRLRECQLLGGGVVQPRELSALSDCVASCRARASCEELTYRYCRQTARGDLLDCESACFEPVDCQSGRQTYSLLERCDGTRQCDDGSDELGCRKVSQPPRYCADDGERIWPFQVCNGRRDCKDGTDERDCPSEVQQFTCKGAIPQRILRSQVCDLVADCLDGSDESAAQGCAQFSCPR